MATDVADCTHRHNPNSCHSYVFYKQFTLCEYILVGENYDDIFITMAITFICGIGAAT